MRPLNEAQSEPHLGSYLPQLSPIGIKAQICLKRGNLTNLTVKEMKLRNVLTNLKNSFKRLKRFNWLKKASNLILIKLCVSSLETGANDEMTSFVWLLLFLVQSGLTHLFLR